MKCLENRPAAVMDSQIKIKRVQGGYIVNVESMTKNERYYRPRQLIAKSIHEVLIFVKEWASPVKPHEEEQNDNS